MAQSELGARAKPLRDVVAALVADFPAPPWDDSSSSGGPRAASSSWRPRGFDVTDESVRNLANFIEVALRFEFRGEWVEHHCLVSYLQQAWPSSSGLWNSWKHLWFVIASYPTRFQHYLTVDESGWEFHHYKERPRLTRRARGRHRGVMPQPPRDGELPQVRRPLE